MVFLVAACSETGGSSSRTKQNLVVAVDPVTGEEIVTTQSEARTVRFFSRDNLRETYFTGDTNPRLGNDDNTGPRGFLNLARVNTGPDGARQGNAEAYDKLTAEDIVVEPLRRQQVIGNQWQPKFSETRTVSLNYTDEPLGDVVQDILGGILGVNFVTSETLEGTLTFRSEQRFARSELVQLLSDVLARNGYLIQYFNGVYHIGLPSELETLTGLRGRTGLEDDQTYIIRLRRDTPNELTDVVASLIPPGNTIARVPDSRNLLVRGDPSQFVAIEELVLSLIDIGPGNQEMAIFPTRNSPPETVADQINVIYQQRQIADILVIPVDSTPGVLVVANDARTLVEVRRLVRNLDVENRDAPQVRVVQLKYLNAEDMAQRLAEIFSGSGVPSQGDGVLAGDRRETSNIIQAAIDGANAGADVRGGAVDGGDNLPVPRFLRGRTGDANDTENGQPAAPSQQTFRPIDEIGFAANSRNNALLVKSRFAEFKRIKEVVEALDVPLAQVVIEATIVEVDINDSLQYGIQAFLQTGGFALRSSSTSGPADPGGSGFVATLNTSVGSTSIQGVISALQSVTNVRVISSPYLTVVDGAKSRLSVGDQIPFVTASQTSNSNGSVTVTQEVNAKDVGVILDVTPRISPDNTVFLDITQQVSSARNVETEAGQNPVIAQRSIQSQITVESGRTVLLGGLIQERTDNSENGIPVLRKIPVVGEAFNRTNNVQTRSELLVMITPKVVRNSDQLNTLTRKLKWWTNANR